MLKKSPFVIAAACGLCGVLVLAQEAPPAATPSAPSPAVEKKADETKPADHGAADKPSPRPTPKPSASGNSPAPVPELIATPAPKRSFFQRLFGSHKSKPVATPPPVSTPTPSPTPRKNQRKPAATPTPAPVMTPKPGKPKPEKPGPIVGPEKPPTTPKPAKPASTPKLDMPKVAPVATPGKIPPATPAKAPAATPKKAITTKPPGSESRKPLIEPPADADPDVKERYRFEVAKGKAAEDPQVKSLKAKADDASTDEDSRKALRAYNKALFEKIRKIDSSVSERADRLEAAILKRLSE